MTKQKLTFLLILAAFVLSTLDGSATETLTPTELVASTPKGQLKNAYSARSAAAKEGHKIYMSLDCSGCHGGGGGGGMAAPLTNPIWIYGSDDDTLFRLIVLGTIEFQKEGYVRKGSEFVVGPMPPFGDTIKPRMTSGKFWLGLSRHIAWKRRAVIPELTT